MGFQQGLSGLSAASKELDVIGNNVANANTVGFKQSRAEFADLYANSLTAISNTQVGIGVQTVNVVQNFFQGNVTTTQNPLDLAISGPGFFQVNSAESGLGVAAYTRNGQFKLNKDGYFENNGYFLTGYQLDDFGNEIGAEGPLNIQNLAQGVAKATSNVNWNFNLDASSTSTPPIATQANGGYDVPDPAVRGSYSYTNTTKFFDNLGSAHSLTIYFVKRPATPPATQPNTWDVFRQVDGGTITNDDGTAAPAVGNTPTQISFDSLGQLQNTPVTFQLTAAQTGLPLANPVVVHLDGTTQYAGQFAVTSVSNDGFPLGNLASVGVGSDGLVTARFSNGYVKNIGHVKIYNFVNPEGLRPVGNNRWLYTSDAGAKTVGSPDSTGLGALQSGALEDSNVDTTAELVNMITAQRFYQANAQTIKTEDSILQTLLNLR
ncbi:flagellar hook protein FlgE [Vogesella sp. LIG4]|uniref:flagellar hook protein FlgE n=1 Tax=Vogesella sp. LIG4 TaxID=1192162 RepID=UPI00081F82A9|nr:flagellar hook protein FlgE [Vogesella sp. LIG4]SCK30331.1 flagellar hook protein FlgE [Vogesella sp. LIG4]